MWKKKIRMTLTERKSTRNLTSVNTERIGV